MRSGVGEAEYCTEHCCGKMYAEHDTARMWEPGIWNTPHAAAILLHAIGRTAGAQAAVVDAWRRMQEETSLVTRLPEDADLALAPAEDSSVLKIVRTILL
jgi:hypothetical protein